MVAFLSGAVLTAANLNSAFNALTFRAVTGTSDTFVLADNGGAVSYSNASPITATVPPFSSVAYANGTTIQLLNLGAGVVTVTAGVGVTINGTPVTLAQNVGGRLIKTATNTWYFLPGASASGMDLITPTSVAGSGVTLSGGLVTIAAASTASVNGCFTSAYENYRVVLTLTTAPNTMTMRYRASSTDATTNYSSKFVYGAYGATTVLGDGNVSAGTAARISIGSGAALYVFDVMGPALAAATFHAGAMSENSYAGSLGGYHSTATAYDGLSIITAASTFTGSLRIYGLRNS